VIIMMIFGLLVAVVGLGAIVYANKLKIPFIKSSFLAWGIPIGITVLGLLIMYKSHTQRLNSAFMIDISTLKHPFN